MENLWVCTVIMPLTTPKFKLNPKCTVPKCDACQLSWMMKQNHGVTNQAVVPGKVSIMLWDKYEVGGFVSVDKCVVENSGCFTSGYDHGGCHFCFHGGNIFEMRQLA